MGLFDGLKHLFNIGGATFEVALEHDVQYQGSTISGEITVTGGSISQDVNVLTIDLVEYWTETRGHGKNRRTVTVTDVHATEELEHHFTIEAGSSQVFQFTHQLPPTARLSTGRTGWRLVLNADVSGGIDPCHTTTLEVEPAAQILRVGDVLESRLRFSEQVAKRHWYVGSRMTRMRFLPPESIRPHLDYLQLELQLDYDGNLSGELRFDLQERSITDYLKAIINIDQRTLPVHIPSHLVDAEVTHEDEQEIALILTNQLEAALGDRVNQA